MRRSLTRFDVTCLGLNAIVGSGIFLLPDDLYREMGALSPLAFLLCGVGLLPVALCYAEAASYSSETGGPYLYARDAFGPRAGFLVVWMCYVNALFSFAAVAAAAAAYAARLVPGLELVFGPRAIGAAVIALFAALNYIGAKPGAIAVDAFTIAKFAVLVVLVGALVPSASAAPLLSTELPHGWSGIGAATFIALFAAQGFEVAPVPAGETRAPQRDLPFAIVGSLVAATLLYVLVQTVLVASGANLAEPSDAPLVDAARAVAPALAFLVVAGGLVSTLGFVSGSALGTPRYLFAAALDRHLPGALGAVHPSFGSPHVAIVATAAIASALVISFDYRSLIGISNVAVAVQYLATCAAVPFLRRRGVPGRRVPGGLLVPLLGCAVSLWVFTEASREELYWAAGALAIGIAVLALRRQPS
jgi:APA family basic amino acid/polyamine antiporter